MIINQQCYIGQDGFHFPDTFLGSELYYSFNVADWLANVSDASIASVEWTTEDDIEIQDSYEETDMLFIKLGATCRGTFLVTCTINTLDTANRTNKKVVPINLRVY